MSSLLVVDGDPDIHLMMPVLDAVLRVEPGAREESRRQRLAQAQRT